MVMPAFIQIVSFLDFKHQPFPVCVGDYKKSLLNAFNLVEIVQ